MKEVAATIDDPADKRAAKHDIADVEDILDEELNGSPISVAMTRRRYAGGAPRAGAGMTAIGNIT